MTYDTLIANKSVFIRDGKIIEIGNYKNLSLNKQTIIINGKGKFLMRGLADMSISPQPTK